MFPDACTVSLCVAAEGDTTFRSTSDPIDDQKLKRLLNSSVGAGAGTPTNETVLLPQLFPQAVHLFTKAGAAAKPLDISNATYQSAYVNMHERSNSVPSRPRTRMPKLKQGTNQMPC